MLNKIKYVHKGLTATTTTTSIPNPVIARYKKVIYRQSHPYPMVKGLLPEKSLVNVCVSVCKQIDFICGVCEDGKIIT